MNSSPLSVTELTAQIKVLLEQGFSRVEVCGEVSRVTRPASGHAYFTIKDQHAAISAVLWRSTLQRLSIELLDGQEYLFSGHISLYEPRGTYQLVVTRVEKAGVGKLAEEFEKRKAHFASLGWFDVDKKQAIPALPGHIGVVTSESTAAFEDVRKVLAARPGWLQITLAPAVVQGSQAAQTIATAIRQLNRLSNRPDVILLVRGGGSVEDLWCFNDEKVVLAIVESDIPVLTGIGHEIDVTLSDFAADLRAATPSNAAELCCPSRAELKKTMPSLASIHHGLSQRIRHGAAAVASSQQQLHFQIRQKSDRYLYAVSFAQQRISGLTQGVIGRSHQRVRGLTERLNQQEPGIRLRRQRQQLHAAEKGLQKVWGERHQRLNQWLMETRSDMQSLMMRQLNRSVKLHDQQFSRLLPASRELQRNQRRALEISDGRLHQVMTVSQKEKQQKLAILNKQLTALGPMQVLRRGYTLSYDAHGNLLASSKQVQPQQLLRVRFHDGSVMTQVKEHKQDG